MSGPGTRVQRDMTGFRAGRQWRDEEWDESVCGSCGQARPIVRGSVLRAERQRWGLNSEQVATLLHISAGYLREMERGKRPPTEEMMDCYQRLGELVALGGWREQETARKEKANRERSGRRRHRA